MPLSRLSSEALSRGNLVVVLLVKASEDAPNERQKEKVRGCEWEGEGVQ